MGNLLNAKTPQHVSGPSHHSHVQFHSEEHPTLTEDFSKTEMEGRKHTPVIVLDFHCPDLVLP